MSHIKWLTPEQKSEGQVYCRKYKSDQSKNMLRNFIVFAIEEEFAPKYYLIDDQVVSIDYATSSKEEISKGVFDFVGHGRYVGSETNKGTLDKDLLTFYKNNPTKIPSFHQELFYTLTAPRPRKEE